MLACIFFAIFVIAGLGATYNAFIVRRNSRRIYWRIRRRASVRFSLCMVMMMIAAVLTFVSVVAPVNPVVETAVNSASDVNNDSVQRIELLNQTDVAAEEPVDAENTIVFVPYI